MFISKQHRITHAEIKYYKYFHLKGVCVCVCQEYEENNIMKHSDTSCVEWNSDVIKTF